MDKFKTHQVTMGIKKSIKQQNSKQKRHIAPKSKEFRSWILRKAIDNGKNNSLNIWILDNPKIWGTHLNRREVVMNRKSLFWHSWSVGHLLLRPSTWFSDFRGKGIVKWRSLHQFFPKSVQLNRTPRAKSANAKNFSYKRGLGVKSAHLTRNLA